MANNNDDYTVIITNKITGEKFAQNIGRVTGPYVALQCVLIIMAEPGGARAVLDKNKRTIHSIPINKKDFQGYYVSNKKCILAEVYCKATNRTYHYLIQKK